MQKRENPCSFSSLEREQNLNTLQSSEFDLLVIGGGATGCGIALDAASRGLKTALIEKNDFASGTSSRSTKLIHGGLRYLKQFEFGLVRETGTERAIVHRLAPHLVQPEKMLLPIIKGGTYSKLAASVGVKIYDILAGVRDEDKRRMLNKQETLEKEPLLDDKVLKGSCFFAEYRTDDARLTIELAKTAASYGALMLNYMEATGFAYENGKVRAVIAKDGISGKEIEIISKQVVSAGGPWVDNLRKKDDSLKGKRLHLTKGVHIVFPFEKLPLQQAVYFDIPDGRMIFAIPRGKVSYVGTTDTHYTGDLDKVVADREDADYLLEAVNHAFPSLQLQAADIVSNWAGLRPLIHEEGKSASELSRSDEIFYSPSGLISIAGGKLTGYRKMAQRVVNQVCKKLGENFGPCITRNIFLSPDPLQNSAEVATYRETLTARTKHLGLDPYNAWYLTTTYGKQADQILDIMNPEGHDPEIEMSIAEVQFCLQHEMIHKASDFFVRRTGRLFFDIASIEKVRDAVFGELASQLAWSEERRAAEEKELDSLLFDASHFQEVSDEKITYPF